MNFHILGNSHPDPLGPATLEDCLIHLQSNYTTPPLFIVLEWAETNYRHFINRQTALAELLQKEWPDISENNRNILASTLGYEPQISIKVFPKSEFVWLEDFRGTVTSGLEVEKGRLRTFRRKLEDKEYMASDNSMLEEISRGLWSVDMDIEYQKTFYVQNDFEDLSERDKRWENRTLEELRNDTNPDNWGVAIVGAVHTLDRPKTYRRLLEEAGVKCNVEILNPF